jgi:hypothetical protein
MSDYDSYDDEFDDEFNDDELSNDDEPAITLPCPECGESVYEESPQCPYCGVYITHNTRPLAGKPWWFLALGLLGILAVIWLLSGLGF